MRTLAIVLWLAACHAASVPASSPPPDTSSPGSLQGSAACGTQTCHGGQVCVTITAGHTCDTTPDAGVGEYGVLAQYCEDLPAKCNGTPSCGCIGSCSLPDGEGRPCLNVEGRDVSCGCF